MCEQYARTLTTGEVLCSPIHGEQMPNVPCIKVKIKAPSTNTGLMFIGLEAVQRPSGATNTATGWELNKSEETDWLLIDNLNRLYQTGTVPSDSLVYIALV